MVSGARLLLACVALAGCGGTSMLAPATPSALASGQSIRGGLLSQGVDAAGAARRPTGPFTALSHPIAVAAAGPELYVLDAGLGMLVRLDPFSHVLVRFESRPFRPGMRIVAAPDLTLYVLDPAGRRLQRFARDGQLIASFEMDAAIGTLTEFVLDPARGRILAADGLHAQLLAFHPLGRAFEILPLRAEPRYGLGALGAIALGNDAIYAADPRCACLARIAFDGRVLSTFGHERVRQPVRLVVDRYGRLIVSDRGDRSLKIFRGERLVERIELATLGIAEATDLALAEDVLYVADGPGAQVRMLHVLAPRKDAE